MLNDIHIQNFRGFADLKLEGLSRVNLVVGKNNAGKTSLLEALAIASNPDDVLDKLLGMFRHSAKAVEKKFYPQLIRANEESAVIGTRIEGNCAQIVISRQRHDQGSFPRNGGGGENWSWSIEPTPSIFYNKSNPYPNDFIVSSISIDQRSPDSIIETFADAIRSPEGERRLENLLQSIDNRIKSFRLDYANSTPYIVVDIGLKERIPLTQAGQGVCRLVSIFAELLGQKPQVLFIDEIENGIHYTALPQLWQGIAEAAEQLNVQVFATTHSGECLRAAHEVFSQRPDYGLSVIQLYALEDGTDGRVLDQKHIAAALAGDIELR